MRDKAAAYASEAVAKRTALSVMPQGNAADAIVAAVLAACVHDASVMLGPIQLLVAGPGAGICAVDGRACQPGRGQKRPRGFLSGDTVPDSARVAVPLLLPALAVFAAEFGTIAFSKLAAPAADHAKGARKEVLATAARRGGATLLARDLEAALIDCAGERAGGLLGHDDLSETHPTIHSLSAGDEMCVPWDGAPLHADTVEHVILVRDTRSVVAAASYEVTTRSLNIEALGLEAPLVATPVMRGVRRIAPGTPVETAATIALRRENKRYFALRLDTKHLV